MYTRVVVMVADGARADLMKQLLADGRLPNIQKHIVEGGCYRTALSVFPSTTGPAHIPFVTGLHPGTANVPGYRWLCRRTHDNRRRSIYRHRSLNSPRGMMVGRDMDPEKTISLFEYYDKPSSVLELIDYCPNQSLYKVVARRLMRVVQAHKTDDWSRVDRMVERLIIKRIEAGSECVIGSFFGIDEYSHLYDPFDERTIGAYENIDRAIGNIVAALKRQGVFEQTIMAVVSDHGLSATKVHIPLVDIVKEHGFEPYYYPKLYRRRCDSAVMESGNAMAALYFRRGERWGEHWSYQEMAEDNRIGRLIESLRGTEGVSFVGARLPEGGVVFLGREGILRAVRDGETFDISVEGANPLVEHPVGQFTRRQLFEMTYHHTYPDAVNQLAMLFVSPRSGDLAVSSDPGYDLRLQHEDPEHHSSHGSLHREHMHVPLMFSVPVEEEYVYNYDLVPTILRLTGKRPKRPLDGHLLTPVNGFSAETAFRPAEPTDDDNAEADSENKKKGGLTSIFITVGIILMGMIVVAVFKDDINGVGEYLMTTYGEKWVDFILFALTAVSSTPLALPIWGYALVGIAMGYHVLRLAAIMAVGSATGSYVTFLLGRYFGNTGWVKRRFPNIHHHPWTHGRSKKYVTALLFLGTASPIPCDVFYVACGAKRYPSLLFWLTMIAARFVRYCYLGYGFKYFHDWF